MWPWSSPPATQRKRFDNDNEYVTPYGADAPDMAPFAPRICHRTTAAAARAQLPRVIAPICDRRQPLDVVRDASDNMAFRQAA